MSEMRVEQKSWKELKALIESIYSRNSQLTPYQSWEYLTSTGKGFTARHPLNMVGIKEKNFVLYVDGTPKAIAPLLVKNKNSKREVFLRGHFTGAGNLDFVFLNDFTFEKFELFVREINKSLGCPVWMIDRISEKSITYSYWKNISEIYKGKATKEICVEIPCDVTYDDWYKNLSKSTKQNIRTSYNRLKTDGKNVRYKAFFNQRIPSNLFKDIMVVASKRAIEYDGRNQKWLWRLYYPLKCIDPVIKYLRRNENCFFSAVWIDGFLAASLIGIPSNDGRMIIPRLSYSSDFQRYSPGGILVNETMKELCTLSKYNSFDLSRGEEKYKYTYGGIEHYIWDFEFTVTIDNSSDL